MKSQEQQESIERSARLPISVTGVDAELPVPVALEVIGWNSAGDGLTNYENAAQSAISAASSATTAAGQATISTSEATVSSSYATNSLDQVGLATTQATIAASEATTAGISAATIPAPTTGSVADQLRVASGAAAYELFTPTASSLSVFVGAFTRDQSTASGTQSVTGIGFQPKAIIFLAAQNAVAGEMSFGFGDASNDKVVADNNNATAATWVLDNAVIQVKESGADTNTGTLDSLDADGFTIAWVKTSTPTGTTTIQFLAIK
jgi:hypothetical protein